MSLRKRVRLKASREADLLRLRARHGRTLSPLSDGTGSVALVVSLSEFIYQLKVEAMIAKALELQGQTPVFLVPAGSVTARRYLRAFGMRRFIELPDYVDEAVEREARIESASLLSEALNGGLMDLSFRGAAIGRYVLSTVSRALHEGTVDFTQPRARQLLDSILLVAVRSALASEAILDDLQPGLVLFNERNYAGEAPLSDLALERGINVIQFVSAFQDEAFVFKRYTAETRRLHPRSLSSESWELVKAMPWTPAHEATLERDFARRYDGSQLLMKRNQNWTQKWSADEIRSELGLDPEKKTAVLFSHVLWDANMFYGDDLFSDQEEWFVETLRAACANDRVNWIVKLHPANVWKRRRDGLEGELGDLEAIRDAVGELPAHVKLLLPESPISTRSLFDVVDVGITIRGSIGIELPSFGIPVLTAGTGFYSGFGFTVDSATREDYLRRLGEIQDVPPLTPHQVELARRHAFALFRLRATAFTSFRSSIRPEAEAAHPLAQDLELRVRSRAELEEADDLRRLGDWAVGSRDLDYLDIDAPASIAAMVHVIAEAGMNHDGSLGNAIRLAEVAAECGADAVKFQLHDAAAETTRDAPSPPYFQHESRWEYFERTAFTDEQWTLLKDACERVGIEFLCSVFSLESVERLERIGVARYKIGSGEVTNLELVRRVAATGKPVLLTSGMSSWDELDAAVEAVGVNVTLMQCTSLYPTPPERVGLNVIAELRDRYGKPVGFSDHTLGLSAPFAAVALGAVVVEKHFTLSKAAYGPDAALALEPVELEDLVAGIREIETMLANPVDKDDLEPYGEMKRVFEKSVVAVTDIPTGATIGREMLAGKKPGTGIPAARLPELVGRTARADIPADSVITEDLIA